MRGVVIIEKEKLYLVDAYLVENFPFIINLGFKSNIKEEIKKLKRKKVLAFLDKEDNCYREFLTNKVIPIIDYELKGHLRHKAYFDSEKASNYKIFTLKDEDKKKADDKYIKKYLNENIDSLPVIKNKTNRNLVRLDNSISNKEIIFDLVDSIRDSIVYLDYMRQSEIISILKQTMNSYKKKIKSNDKNSSKTEGDTIKRLFEIIEVLDLECSTVKNNKKNTILKTVDSIYAEDEISYINNLYNFINNYKINDNITKYVVDSYISKKLINTFYKLDNEDLFDAINSLNNKYSTLLKILVDEKIDVLITGNIKKTDKYNLLRQKYLKDKISSKEYLYGSIMNIKNISFKKKNTELVLK